MDGINLTTNGNINFKIKQKNILNINDNSEQVGIHTLTPSGGKLHIYENDITISVSNVIKNVKESFDILEDDLYHIEQNITSSGKTWNLIEQIETHYIEGKFSLSGIIYMISGDYVTTDELNVDKGTIDNLIKDISKNWNNITNYTTLSGESFKIIEKFYNRTTSGVLSLSNVLFTISSTWFSSGEFYNKYITSIRSIEKIIGGGGETTIQTNVSNLEQILKDGPLSISGRVFTISNSHLALSGESFHTISGLNSLLTKGGFGKDNPFKKTFKDIVNVDISSIIWDISRNYTSSGSFHSNITELNKKTIKDETSISGKIYDLNIKLKSISGWSKKNNIIFTKTNIGIGSNNISGTVFVDGNMIIGSNVNNYLFIGPSFNNLGASLFWSSGLNVNIYNSTLNKNINNVSGIIFKNILRNDVYKNCIGIDTITPSGKIHISGGEYGKELILTNIKGKSVYITNYIRDISKWVNTKLHYEKSINRNNSKIVVSGNSTPYNKLPEIYNLTVSGIGNISTSGRQAVNFKYIDSYLDNFITNLEDISKNKTISGEIYPLIDNLYNILVYGQSNENFIKISLSETIFDISKNFTNSGDAFRNIENFYNQTIFSDDINKKFSISENIWDISQSLALI